MPRPPRPWFRFYSEILESRKAQALGRKNPMLFVHWVNLLSLANVTRPRGSLPSAADMAYRLRVSEPEVDAILKTLRSMRFIDKHGSRLSMHDWDEWQYESDANQTPGRKTRAHGTSKERGRNALNTPKERIEAEAEADTEAEKETEAEADTTRRPPLRLFEQCFGRLLSPMEIEQGRALIEEHPQDRIEYAIRESSDLNRRSMRYIQSICERIARGEPDDRPSKRLQATVRANGRGTRNAPTTDITAEWERYAAGEN